MKKFFLIISLGFLYCFSGYSQIPPTYYDNAIGLSGTALQQALHDIIDNHNTQSYTSLWTHVQTTDKKPNGKVWDIYSDIPGGTPPYEFSFGSDQCGSYSNEGDCYNREHSFPKSWFNDQSPMYSDLFHIYPTDGKVNGTRGNFPYGEADSIVFWTSLNGCKTGYNTTPGYTGLVFEPIDEYKGDIARTYFYMATRYYTEDSNWPGSDMVDGSQPFLWALEMLKNWHIDDSVSQKEIDRNNAIYVIQNNRNPFIDHPEWVEEIWGPPVNLGVKEQTIIHVYPIPSCGIFHVDVSKYKSTLEVYDFKGEILYSSILHEGENTVELSLSAGVYYLVIYLDNGEQIKRKMVIL